MRGCTKLTNMWIIWILLLEFVLLVLSGERKDFHEIIEEYWNWRLKQVPEFASSVGVHDYDHRLELFNMQAYEHRRDKCQMYADRLLRIDRNRLTPSEQLDHLVLLNDLQTYVDGYEWRHYGNLNPINFLEGNQRDFSFWLDAMDFSTEEGFDNYIVRLRALATQIFEQINLMNEAISRDFTNHQISVQTIPDEIQALETNPFQTPFFKPFNDSLKYTSMSANKQEKIRQTGEIVVADQVLPAYKRLKQFLIHEYIPNTRPNIGLASIPGGLEYYQVRLQWHLSLGVVPDPTAIHRLGQTTVQNLLRQMEEVKSTVGYEGELHEFLKFTNGASKFFYRNEHELLQAYKDCVKKIKRKMPRFFKYSKVQNFQIQQMPFDGPAGVMMPGSEDGMMRGVFFVNVKNPLRWPKWKLMTVTLHETLPGRLLQVEYERNQSLPDFRKFREFRKSYAAPFQFPFHSAYIEGWALYAESLGKDMKLLQDGYLQFGQLFSELYRACEMVVDTGIHAFGWTRDEASSYIVRHTGVSTNQAEQDVDQIITIPGQAVAPEYGHLTLKLLREKAENKFGPMFDIREFHHQILKLGPVPLKTLETHISMWIQKNAPETTSSASKSGSHCSLISIVTLCIIFLFDR